MVELELKIPDDFFSEEMRCDFWVDHQRKEIWAVELDLLEKLLNICKKYQIKIFASGGTLLGAVRHCGFIPWDDDIDMMMFREDYEKLCAIAPNEFQYPYFFQTEYTDPGSMRGHAQLRNSQTTAILKSEAHLQLHFNQGIFIDIFPLDSVVDEKKLLEKQSKKAQKFFKKAERYSGISRNYNKESNVGLKKIAKQIMRPMTNRLVTHFDLDLKAYKQFEDECKKYNHIRTELVSTLSLDFDNQLYYKNRKDFEEIIELPFEFMKIPVGKNFHHALKKRFGDYKKIIRDKSVHGQIIFDTNQSFLNYFNSRM
jgi:lipopolysaccharide cholinephosphotransferase